MYKNILVVFCVIILGSCKLSTGQDLPSEHTVENRLTPAVQIKNDLQFYNIEERLTHYGIPSFSMALIKNGKVVFSKAYGNGRRESGVKASPRSIYQVGSISKSITAATVMKMEGRGEIDLDVDVNNYLTSWAVPSNKFTASIPITLRHLLSHRAGINNANTKGFTNEESLPSLVEYISGKTKYPGISVDTFADIRYRYSNLGYALVQLILEDVTDLPFWEVARNEVLDPLGMSHSSFEIYNPNDADEEVVYAYQSDGDVYDGKWNNAAAVTSGGLYSSPEELSKYVIEIWNCLNGNGKLLSQESVRQMVSGKRYGLGFDLAEKNGLKSISHTGRVPGFYAYMHIYEESGDGYVMTVNSDNGGDFLREVLRGLSDINNWGLTDPLMIDTVVIDNEELTLLQGKYEANIGGQPYTATLYNTGGRLVLEDMEGEKFPLAPIDENKFMDMIDAEKLTFTKNEKGLPISFMYNDEYEFVKKE